MNESWREAERRNLENLWFERSTEKTVQRFEAMKGSVSGNSFSFLFVSVFHGILFDLIAEICHFLSQYAKEEEEDDDGSSVRTHQSS